MWKPIETTASLQVLNEETQKNARVFMTIAVDLVLNGLQDPVRFCIETKVRIYPQNEKFWVYQKHKHFEQFFLQISRALPPPPPTPPASMSTTTITTTTAETDSSESVSQQQQSQTPSESISPSKKSPSPTTPHPSNPNQLSLLSIFSSTEMVRKKHALEHQRKIDNTDELSESAATGGSQQQAGVPLNMSDDENDLVMSGLGNVSKDCAQEDLMDWSEILAKWRKATWNERPKGLQTLVRKGKLTKYYLFGN